jgi:hypothetical protein
LKFKAGTSLSQKMTGKSFEAYWKRVETNIPLAKPCIARRLHGDSIAAERYGLRNDYKEKLGRN